MARTPLLRGLGRIARGGAASAPSRAAFVAGASAALSSLALGARAARAATHQPRIAIVGAGISGLTAALILQDRGISSEVYEASSRIGGRMHSEHAYWGGQTTEYCGELIDTDHTTMHALVRRFSLDVTDVLLGQPADAQETFYFDGRYYRWSEAERDFRALRPELERQAKALGYFATYDRATPFARELDRISVYEWIARYVAGGHRSPFGQFIDYSYLAEYGIDTRLQSALNLVYYIAPQPFYDDATGDFNVLGASDQRYHILDGNQRLPLAIAANLPQGSIHKSHRLAAIARRADGRVDLTFDARGRSVTETFDKAIVTVPFSVLRGLDLSRAGFDRRKMTAIDDLAYGRHAKLFVEFDRRFWNRPGAWPGVSTGDITTDLPFVQTWEETRGQGGTRGILVDYLAGDAATRLSPPVPYGMVDTTPVIGTYAQAFLGQLERVFPGAKAHATGRSALGACLSDANLLGSYSCWLVGQYTAFAGYEKARQGNVLFAGEHCSVEFQGFMEGAAREGARAAREILGDLGLHAA